MKVNIKIVMRTFSVFKTERVYYINTGDKIGNITVFSCVNFGDIGNIK